MVVLFALADAIGEEKGKVVPVVRPQPLDEACARLVRTRRASFLRTDACGLRLGRITGISGQGDALAGVARALDLGTKKAGRTTISNLIML